MLSLNARLLIGATLVLVAFLGLTGLALDRAFRQSILESSRDGLQTQIYMLLGAANVDGNEQLFLPDTLPEPRLSTLGSGLYAEVRDGNNAKLWSSPSALGVDIPYPRPTSRGVSAFTETIASDGASVLALGYTVTWELQSGHEQSYTFHIAESRAGIDAQVGGFRRSLWVWLVGAALVLLVAQGVILTWSLAPLRRVARAVREIEAGKRQELAGRYPRELRLLTENLNALIRNSHSRLTRYRDSLADLAHSLKTPLAVLRSATDDDTQHDLIGTVREQVARMDQTVEYQLQRAAASGRSVLSAPVDVHAIAQQVLNSLSKVYREKRPRLELLMEPGTLFPGDRGDLTEIVGNLADNACKWCSERVVIRAPELQPADGSRAALVLEVEDDGPGIAAVDRNAVLRRGVRTNGFVSGQGIGLAVVRELVEEVYGGTVEITDGKLGGALVRVRL